MSASKYLPPFTPEERGTAAGSRGRRASADPADVAVDGEVTYADFLGDQVDD
ncbi:hypothetical protein [Curtobacterium luteum]|uniref:hypothetical protein n=1 Tax=Curtobacterium luteum TaxID=33881 RepID=UPI000A7645C3|nr:hypothetical protein [Curtobacterium luteum]